METTTTIAVRDETERKSFISTLTPDPTPARRGPRIGDRVRANLARERALIALDALGGEG